MRTLRCDISISEHFPEEHGEVLMFFIHYPKTKPPSPNLTCQTLHPQLFPESLFPSGRAAAEPELIHTR